MADFLQRNRPLQGRVIPAPAVDEARIGDGRAGESAHRPRRDGVDPDSRVAEIDGKITHRRLQGGLGHAHNVVVRRHPLGPEVGERDQRPAVGHQGLRQARDGGEGVAGDLHGLREVGAAGIQVAALQFLLVGVGDRMDHEIELAPNLPEPLEHRLQRAFRANVALHQFADAELFGQGCDALEEGVPLVGQSQFRAFCVNGLRNTPSDRMIVGNAHDQAALATHQAHRRVVSSQKLQVGQR